MSEGTDTRPSTRLSVAGVVFGAGLASTIDEVVFHQILHWHHLYDGTIQHKVLRLHQVRYEVEPALYDILFIGVSAAIFVAGAILWRAANRASGAETVSAP
jgi:uncharacterized membrane protein